jgi:hypothetical protein
MKLEDHSCHGVTRAQWGIHPGPGSWGWSESQGWGMAEASVAEAGSTWGPQGLRVT